MKKILPLLVFGLCSFIGYSQKTNNNEVKINLPYFIYGLPEVSYERIIDSTASAGISFAISLDKPETVKTRWTITPYYRLYFGKEKAKGFFIEGSATCIHQKIPDLYDYTTGSTKSIETTNFGFGASLGIKFLNKKRICWRGLCRSNPFVRC